MTGRQRTNGGLRGCRARIRSGSPWRSAQRRRSTLTGRRKGPPPPRWRAR